MIMLVVFIMVIMAYCRTDKSYVEVLPATKTKIVEVEIFDEMTKEKVRNLYEEQDIFNAKISFLMRQNKQYEHDIAQIDDKIQRNLDDMRTQLMIQPGMDIRILKAGYEQSNQNLYKHKLKLEGMVLTNSEKIVAYKKKSNAISEQITKIGKEIYNQRMR